MLVRKGGTGISFFSVFGESRHAVTGTVGKPPGLRKHIHQQVEWKAEIPVVTRECRRNSRETTWFPPLGKMRLGRKPPRAPQLEETPETPPSSRDEGLLLLYGLESNPESSLQTPQEA